MVLSSEYTSLSGFSQKKDLILPVWNIYRKTVEDSRAYSHFIHCGNGWTLCFECVLHSFHRVYYDNG